MTHSPVQATVLQLDNYGPWTVTPEPRYEMNLQALQARLFADVADTVGRRGGYVFPARFDNMIGITNGVDRAAHTRLQTDIADRYPVTASVGLGVAETPAAAVREASEQLQQAGSAQSADRTEVLAGTTLEAPDAGAVTVAHFDVVDVTGRYTDTIGAFEALVQIDETIATLQRHMYRENEAVTFFVGGDNAIALCPDLDEGAFETAIDQVHETAGVELQVGVGRGPTPQDAGMTAKHALEVCRANGTRVEHASPAVHGD